MIIKFGEYGVLDTEKLELRILGKSIKLRPTDTMPKQYLEPFIGVKEPESWIRIERRHVFVKAKNMFLEGEIS